MSKITDVVLAPSLRHSNDFMRVMRGILKKESTIELSMDMQLRGHRPDRIWILKSDHMPECYTAAWQKAEALVLCARKLDTEVITVSDWR